MVFQKGHKKKSKTVEELDNKEQYGLIEDESKLNEDEYINKVMKALGYEKKRAMNYNYYIKSGMKVQSLFKEKELKEIFKNE